MNTVPMGKLMGQKQLCARGREQVSQADWNRLKCEDREDSLTGCRSPS